MTTMRRAVALLLTACAVGAGVVAPVAPVRGGVAAPLSPNGSLLFFRHSGKPNSLRAVLNNGDLMKKGPSRFSSTFTNVAVSRDTLLLYDKSSGSAVSGTFVNGTYTKKHTYKLAKGWDFVVSGCDTAVLVDRDTRTAAYGLLEHGAFTIADHFGTGPVTNVAASCDTLLLYDRNGGGATTLAIGGGEIGKASDVTIGIGWTRVAATGDSVLFYDGNRGTGVWGTLQSGAYQQTGGATDFVAGFTSIAGTANSMLFYKRGSPHALIATLAQGFYTYYGAAPTRSDWDLIGGGK